MQERITGWGAETMPNGTVTAIMHERITGGVGVGGRGWKDVTVITTMHEHIKVRWGEGVGWGEWGGVVYHIPSIAFRHLPPNSARFSYATEGAIFISAQLSTDAVSALQKVRALIRLWKQPSAQART